MFYKAKLFLKVTYLFCSMIIFRYSVVLCLSDHKKFGRVMESDQYTFLLQLLLTRFAVKVLSTSIAIGVGIFFL